MLESGQYEEKKGSKKTQAVLWAVVIHVGLFILFALIVILPAIREKPELVAQVMPAGIDLDPKKQKRSVTKQVEKASAASSASPIARLMRANATAVIAAPEVKKISEGPIGLGEGDFGDGGFGSGSGGMGSGASFFGSKKTKGKRFLFILDYSASVNGNQRSITEAEMERALGALGPPIQYQVLLFAGPAWYAGWNVSGNRNNPTVTDEDGKGSYQYRSVRGAGDFEFEGSKSELPKAPWLTATKANVKGTIEAMRDTKLVWGTDWAMAMEVGHLMDPPPDVIFFMADGTGGNDPPPILKINEAAGTPVIHMFAMQTSQGRAQFAEIAEKTGGEYRVIVDGKTTVPGEEYKGR
ncbi:MAG: hypothetical protein AAF591_10145 [Verrucomicrobiota bacterium]